MNPADDQSILLKKVIEFTTAAHYFYKKAETVLDFMIIKNARQQLVFHRLISLILLLFFSYSLHAQFVRRETYETEHQRRMHYALDDWVSYLKSRLISSVAVGTEYLYFGTLDGGILRYHLYQNYWDFPFTTSNGLPDNQILDVAYDRQGSLLWAVTPGDTAVFKPAEQEWLWKSQTRYWNYKFPRPPRPDTAKTIQENIFYPRNYLNLLPLFFANGPFDITGNWTLLDEYLREYTILGFLKDQWQRIWFVVDDFGVGIGDLFSQRADFYEYGLSDIYPRAVNYHHDDLWVGGVRRGEDRPGIVRWRNSDGGWEYYEARLISCLANDNVHAILPQGDSIWFATDFGVALYDAQRDKWKTIHMGQGLISNQVNDLAWMGDFIYVATDQGISRIMIPAGIVQRIKDERFLNLSFNRLAVQKDTLWAATDRGIFRFVSALNKWEFVPSAAAISDFPVTAVDVYHTEVWFAARGGIMKLDVKTGKWTSFPQIALEIAQPYRDIKANSRSVWVCTPDGLLKFDKERQYWRIFTTNDGLLDDDCYRVLLDGDYLWVATSRGITQFYWNREGRID